MPRPSTRTGVLALAVALAAVLAVAGSSPWLPFLTEREAWPQSDLQILWAAGHGLAEGRDVTDPAVLDELGRRAGRDPTPFSASHPLLARLHGELPDDFPAAYERALVLNAGWALLCVLLLALLARGDGRTEAAVASDWLLWLALATAAVGLCDGLWMSLAMNSTNLPALALVLAALWAAVARRPLLEGVLLGLAVLAKTSPALLVLTALMAGRVKTGISAGLTWLSFCALSVFWMGPDPLLAWTTRTLPALGYGMRVEPDAFDNALHSWNLSPYGLLTRSALRSGLPPGLVWVAALLVASLVLWQLWLVARTRRDPLGLGAATLAGSLLISSVTWPHHLVFVALPATVLVLRGRRLPLLGGLGLLASVVLMLPLGSFDSDPSLPLEGPLRTAAAVLLFAASVACCDGGAGVAHVAGDAAAPQGSTGATA